MKINFVSILLLTANLSLLGQNSSRSNQIYFELGGFGAHYSINYSKDIDINNTIGINLGIGFSTSLIYNLFDFSPRIPIQCKVYQRINQHSAEFGFGLTLYSYYESTQSFKENLNKTEKAILCQNGYKYTFKSELYFIGAAFTPLLIDKGRFDFFPWIALRAGRQF